tara:strand:- start:799 stop:1071 length:273 start_codon:yes stop_codon:yes gene_type:complete
MDLSEIHFNVRLACTREEYEHVYLCNNLRLLMLDAVDRLKKRDAKVTMFNILDEMGEGSDSGLSRKMFLHLWETYEITTEDHYRRSRFAE